MWLPCLVHPQLNCSRLLSPGQAQATQHPAVSVQWLLCAEDWLLPAADRPCVAYSFRCAQTSVPCTYASSCAVMHSYHWHSWNKQCNAYLIMHAIIFKPPLSSPACLSVSFSCLSLVWMEEIQPFWRLCQDSDVKSTGLIPATPMHLVVTMATVWLVTMVTTEAWSASTRCGWSGELQRSESTRQEATRVVFLKHWQISWRLWDTTEWDTQTDTHSLKCRETVPNKHTLESFHPNILRKLSYLAVPIATGLCAIPGCHGNNLSEWITLFPSYSLQPQEGTTYLQFECVLVNRMRSAPKHPFINV